MPVFAAAMLAATFARRRRVSPVEVTQVEVKQVEVKQVVLGGPETC